MTDDTEIPDDMVRAGLDASRVFNVQSYDVRDILSAALAVAPAWFLLKVALTEQEIDELGEGATPGSSAQDKLRAAQDLVRPSCTSGYGKGVRRPVHLR